MKTLGHESQLAGNGQEAWEAILQEPFDVVIADWMMPEMDGLSLCRKIREADFDHYIYLILCTGRDQRSDLLEAMAAGADDFSVKPPKTDEITVRMRAAERIRRLQSSLQEKNRQLQVEHKKLTEAYGRIESDLMAAAENLESLLPPRVSAELPVKTWFHFKPSHILGGDFLNFFKLGDNHLGLYVLDVSGHGIPAALRAASLSRILTPSEENLLLAPETGLPRAPSFVAKELNRRFLDGNDYFTMVYATLNLTTLEFVFVQAGHPAPLLVRDGVTSRLGEGGYPVSLLDQAQFEDNSVKLRGGDRIFLFSDGLSEAERAPEEFFGEERIAHCLSCCSKLSLEDSIASVISEVADFCGGFFEDDVSLFGLEIPGP
jgi:sigma-B regulation protein RsbU (phosphoserine phosphatase)